MKSGSPLLMLKEKDLLGRPIPQHLIECKNLQTPLILHLYQLFKNLYKELHYCLLLAWSLIEDEDEWQKSPATYTSHKTSCRGRAQTVSIITCSLLFSEKHINCLTLQVNSPLFLLIIAIVIYQYMRRGVSKE